ncbi:hypothetical protein ACIRST_15330 [Kitasatospora sp. NPDC101447]|uniref:hypothetical protein n=1 Tax=Kitasatospora sp. NPDC101447 TaxID=3364102 RepID=UPI003828E52C
MTDIIFANVSNPITPDISIIHDDDSFRVQWSARNVSNHDISSFVDRLVIQSIPEGCPGSDSVDHDTVFDSDVDGAASDFTEPDLRAGTAGPLMNPSVGPFSAGDYRLTVTLAKDLGVGHTTFDCITIVVRVTAGATAG